MYQCNINSGPQLYNVITDTDTVAKKLIARKCVAQRVTYMPLNKVNAYSLNPSVIRNARKHSGDNNVWTAMELIEFSPDLRPAMESVFGGSLVCRDLRVAKVLAYMEGVRARCVTLDGDIVEPSGTMSGGECPSKP